MCLWECLWRNKNMCVCVCVCESKKKDRVCGGSQVKRIWCLCFREGAVQANGKKWKGKVTRRSWVSGTLPRWRGRGLPGPHMRKTAATFLGNPLDCKLGTGCLFASCCSWETSLEMSAFYQPQWFFWSNLFFFFWFLIKWPTKRVVLTQPIFIKVFATKKLNDIFI